MTSREVRAAFWRDHPHLSRRKITNYSGNGKMFPTDVRVAFSDYVDYLSKSGIVSEVVADRVTLSGNG
jgi:hypothetical protein